MGRAQPFPRLLGGWLLGLGALVGIAFLATSSVDPQFDESGNGCRSLSGSTLEELVVARVILTSAAVLWVALGVGVLAKTATLMGKEGISNVWRAELALLGLTAALALGYPLATFDVLLGLSLGLLAAAPALLLVIFGVAVSARPARRTMPWRGWVIAAWVIVPLTVVPLASFALFAWPLYRFHGIPFC